MKTLSVYQDRAVAAVAGLLVFALLGVGGWLVWQKHQQVETTLGDMEIRYARLLGLKANQALLEQGSAAAETMLNRHAYAAGQDATQAGNDAQQRVRALFAGAGLEVVSLQILPLKAEKQFDRIPLTVRLEGTATALQSALVVLAKQSPSVFVDTFALQTIGVVKADTPQRLGIQLSLYVMRRQS